MDLARIIQFVKTDIWRIRRQDLPPRQSFLIRILRILILTIRGLTEDRVQLRASALTYWSLLSIVPIVAMIFGIAKGFGFEKNLQSVLLERLEGQEEVALKIIEFAHALLENVKGGLIAGIGIILLFYTIIKILSNIENAFNDIWGIRAPRSLGRKITDYLSIMLIGPVLFITSSGLTVLISGSIKMIMAEIALLGLISPIILSLLKFLPYCVLWILFSFLYIFMPNAKVQFRAGLLAGVIAGTAYHLFQYAYIHFQIVVSKYNAIYGSFAALPLFFIWLYVSWIIVLFGAEISFAYQNEHTYEFEQDCLNVSKAFKKILTLRVVHLLVQHFVRGEKPLDAGEISHELEIPIRLVRQLIFDLLAAGIIAEVCLDEGADPSYQPARDPGILTVKFVLDAIDHQGSDNLPIAQSEELEHISETIRDLDDLVRQSPANMPLKDL